MRRIWRLAFLASALAGAAFAQDPVDVKPQDLAPGRVCSAAEDCDCYVLTATDTWTLHRCIPVPAPTPEEPPAAKAPRLYLTGLAGGMASMSSSAEETVAPLVRLSAEADLAAYDRPPRLLANVMLSALPGEVLSVERVETVNAVDVQLGLAWQPFKSFFFSFALWGGFTSRIESDPEPLDQTARYACAGLEFDNRKGHSLEVGGCADQRLDATYQPTAVVFGTYRLPYDKVDTRLVVRGILGFDSRAGAPADGVQVGIVLAR